MRVLLWVGTGVLGFFWAMLCLGAGVAVWQENPLLADKLMIGGLAGVFLLACTAGLVIAVLAAFDAEARARQDQQKQQKWQESNQ